MQNFRKAREEKLKELSRNRLYNTSKTKIKTTMIGALATIEKHFSFLIEEDPSMKAVFDEVRSEILDKGNTQIRNLEVEFSKYDIVSKNTNIVLPFIEKGK